MIIYNDEYNKKILDICIANKSSYQVILKSKKCAYLMDYIDSCISDFMDTSEKLGKKVNWVLNKMQGYPKCQNPECSNLVYGKNVFFYGSWPKFCCNRCAQKDPENIKKIKATKKQHFGNENYNGNYEEIKARNREKYGCDWYMQSKEFADKKKATWMSHGYDHPMHSQEIKDGMVERYERRTGYRYSILNPDVIKKAKLPYFFDGIFFKSSWELAFYIYLTDNNVKFKYQPDKRFEYMGPDGKTRYYFPDFEIGGKYYEVKGDQFIKPSGKYRNPYDASGEMDGIYEAKHQCMLENGVVTVSGEEIGKYLQHCMEKFGTSKWKDAFRKIDSSKLSIEIPRDDDALRKEFEYFKHAEASDRRIVSGCNRNLIVRYFQQDVFFAHEKKLWQERETREKLVANRLEFLGKNTLTPNDILAGFKKSGIYYGYSHFNPIWFKWFIENYGARRCYDPCGGWGHRLLGGLSLEKYIYNDLSPTTKANIDRIIDYFGIKNAVTYNNDARTFIPQEDFDSMFTCPPYYNVEEYECGRFGCMEEYQKLLESIFRVFHDRKSCRTLGLVIREDFLPGEYMDFTKRVSIVKHKKKYLSGIGNDHMEYMYIFGK